MDFPPIDTLLFFGSFDPFTIGHEHVISMALFYVRVRSLTVVPAWKAVWNKNLTPFEHRYRMIDLALHHMPEWGDKVSVSRIEEQEKLEGKTLDTLVWYRDHNPHERFGLLMGSDSLLSFHKWFEWQKILQITRVFVVLRHTEKKERLLEMLDPSLKEFVDKRIFVLPEPEDIPARYSSSTMARSDIQVAGETVHVIPSIMDYIKKNSLYY
jgi:nicotinate-nucleotide adenylyltransferase